MLKGITPSSADGSPFWNLNFARKVEKSGVVEEEELRNNIAATLEAIGRTHMPFGRFGPARFPPHGIPIYDLPAEYLMYFAQKGWPKGRLGYLLQVVYQSKADGCDTIFDVFRNRNGGRTPLRKK